MTVCAKCGHEVYGRATKRGNHPVCPKRTKLGVKIQGRSDGQKRLWVRRIEKRSGAK